MHQRYEVSPTFVRSLLATTMFCLLVSLGGTAAAQEPEEPADAKPATSEEEKKEDGDAGAPKPQPTKAALDEARARYQRGIKLYSDGAYESALIEFERAYELAPAYRILYNIAQVSLALTDYPKALEYFRQYLDEGGADVPEPRRQEVQKQLEQLAGRVAQITIKVNVEGAEVALNGRVVGTTPLAAPLVVNSGRHQIEVTKAGMDSDRKSVAVAGTDEIELEFKLVSRTVLPPPPVPGPRVIGSEPGPSYIWVGWLVTGVLTAGTVASGIAALAASSRADDLRNTFGTSDDDISSKADEARTLAIVTDVLIGASALSGGMTLIFAIIEATDDDGKTEPIDSVRFEVSPTSATIVGTF